MRHPVRIHHPDTDPPYPALIVLHAAGMNPDSMAAATKLHESPYAVVYLSSDGRSWDSNDDIRYVLDALRRLRGLIDPARLVLVGWSSGGIRAFDIAARWPGVFAGLATFTSVMNKTTEPAGPLPILMINDADDLLVPLREQKYWQFRGAYETADAWRAVGSPVELVADADYNHVVWTATTQILDWTRRTLMEPIALDKIFKADPGIDLVRAAQLAELAEITGGEVRDEAGLVARHTETMITVKRDAQ